VSVGDFVRGVVDDVIRDMLRKASASKRSKRRKRTTKPTVAERLRRLEQRVAKPAKRQASRRGRFARAPRRNAAPSERLFP
jgi:hypothetical protein